MSSKLKGASYVKRRHDASFHDTTKVSKRPFAVAVSSIMAVFMFLLVLAPIVTASFSGVQQSSKANAFFEFFCTADIGNGMDNKSQITTTLRSFPNPDQGNRKWTLQEAFGDGANIVNFEGVGEGTDWAFAKEEPAILETLDGYDSDASEKFENVRNVSDCFFGGVSSNVANLIFGFANVLSGLTQAIVIYAFDTGMICSEPGQDGACIDLLGVIGGESDSDDTGLIAILTNSIYMPLMLIAVALGGITVAYQGIVKRQFRDALGKMIWVVASALLGVIILAFPAGVSQAPMVVTNAIASCVIGSFNGDNCLADNNSGEGIDQIDSSAPTSQTACASHASGLSPNEQMSMSINSLTCSIWKSFILEPYSNASFGLPFAELDTSNEEIQVLIDRAGLEEDYFCINLGSKGSVEDNTNSEMHMNDGHEVCNLAAFQMFLSHDTTAASSVSGEGTPSDRYPSSGQTDDRWYALATLMAQDQGMWNEWTTGWSAGFQDLSLAVLSVFTTMLGGFVLVVISFFALVFKLGAIILTALAPLFLLFMIEPTRGKKMAAGWFGQLLSNIMKYMASALFLLITIVLFGAVLGTAGSNMLANTIFIILLTAALLMYRREIVDLIGKVDMGTQVFSNKIGERIKGTAKLAGSATAGAVGARMGGGTLLAGAKDTFKRDLSRGMGTEAFGSFAGKTVQGVSRQYSRQQVAEAQGLRQEASQADRKHAIASNDLNSVSKEYNDTFQELQDFDSQQNVDANELRVLHDMDTKDQEIHSGVQDEISQLSPEFAQAMAILDEIKNLELEAKVAIEVGDLEKARGLTEQIQGLDGQQKDLMDGIGYQDRRMLHNQYDEMVKERREDYDLNYDASDRARYQDLTLGQIHADDHHQKLEDRMNSLADRGQELELTEAEAKAKAGEFEKEYSKRKPGQEITGRDRNKINEAAEKEAAKKSFEAGENTAFKSHEGYVNPRAVDPSNAIPELDTTDTQELPDIDSTPDTEQFQAPEDPAPRRENAAPPQDTHRREAPKNAVPPRSTPPKNSQPEPADQKRDTSSVPSDFFTDESFVPSPEAVRQPMQNTKPSRPKNGGGIPTAPPTAPPTIQQNNAPKRPRNPDENKGG